jgi:hypothetical protein
MIGSLVCKKYRGRTGYRENDLQFQALSEVNASSGTNNGMEIPFGPDSNKLLMIIEGARQRCFVGTAEREKRTPTLSSK